MKVNSKCVWRFGVLFGFVLAVLCNAACQADDQVKVLFIGKQPDHPFSTHMYLHTGEMLAECLKLSGDIETVVSDGWQSDQSDASIHKFFKFSSMRPVEQELRCWSHVENDCADPFKRV